MAFMSSYPHVVVYSFVLLFLGGCSPAKDTVLGPGHTAAPVAGRGVVAAKDKAIGPAREAESSAYKRARKTNTVASYGKFLEAYPKGKNADRARRRKQTLLDAAILKSAKSGDAGKTRRLIAGGADVNATDRFGNTPLHLAIDGNHPRISNLLIDNGANVDAVGAFGNTPLHQSIHSGQADTTRRLLERDADTRIRNTFGLVADEMARLPEIEALVVSTAKLIDRNGQWKNRRKGRKGYNRLRRRKNLQVVNSIVLKVIHSEDIRLQVLLLAVKLGIPGSENILTDVLKDHGDKAMAEDFLNSGSRALASGARAWAKAHGYDVHSGPGSHRSAWGYF